MKKTSRKNAAAAKPSGRKLITESHVSQVAGGAVLSDGDLSAVAGGAAKKPVRRLATDLTTAVDLHGLIHR